MTDLLLVEFGLVAIAVLTVWGCIKQWRKRKWKGVRYELKTTARNLAHGVSMVMILFIMVASSYATTPIHDWAKTAASNAESPLASWLFAHAVIPLFMVFVIMVSIWQWNMLAKPFEYNAEEKVWNKEDNRKANTKMKEFGKKLMARLKA